MNKYRQLALNTVIFALSNFSSKILVFFMLPLYTAYLSSEEYGVSDLVTVTVGLLLPLCTINIADGVMRFSLDKGADKKSIFSFGLLVLFIGLGVILILYPFFNLYEPLSKYIVYFYLIYIATALYQYFNQFARGLNKIKLVGVVGIITSLVVVGANILLLVVYSMGIDGFLFSILISYTIGAAILFFFGRFYQFISRFKLKSKLNVEIIKYCLPLVPNSFSWFLIHSSNRYLINFFVGMSQVGLFTVASKVPTMLIAFQGIFIQAWQLSAISEYSNEDKEKYFSTVYKYYNFVMVFGCAILISLSQYIAQILFSSSFYYAWKLIPFLVVSVVFGAMIGFISSIFLAAKKTKILFTATLSGGLICVLLNLFTIPLYGAIGATYTSTLTYLIVWMFMLYKCNTFFKLKINLKKNAVEYSIIITQAFITIFWENISFWYNVLSIILILLLNINEIKFLLNKVKNIAINKFKTLK